MGNDKKSFLDTLFEESGKNNAVKDGYFDNYKSNIFGHEMHECYAKMFAAGDGNELFGKACAIHSSSMLAYNMLSWIDGDHPFVYKEVKYTSVFFEVHLPTLKGTRPANMDVVLEGVSSDGKHSILFIESKFTEYFKNEKEQMKKMGVTYNKPDRYFIDNGKKWSDLIKSYREEAVKKSNSGYYDGIKQEICHLIAISNLRTDAGICAYNTLKDKMRDEYDCYMPNISNGDDFVFINLLFKPRKDFKEEIGAFNKYEKLYADLKKDASNLIGGKSIDMKFLTYGELWKEIKGQMPQGQMDYFDKKYMKFSD